MPSYMVIGCHANVTFYCDMFQTTHEVDNWMLWMVRVMFNGCDPEPHGAHSTQVLLEARILKYVNSHAFVGSYLGNRFKKKN